jgi:hypothetical protein
MERSPSPFLAIVANRLWTSTAAGKHGLMSRTAILVLLALLAGCGDSAPGPAGADVPTDVRISFDPDGEGRGRAVSTHVRCARDDRREVCRRLRTLDPRVLRAVPRDRFCTQIYGGPQTGRIHGTIEGRRVDARFARNNGCEIARFAAAAPILRQAG